MENFLLNLFGIAPEILIFFSIIVSLILNLFNKSYINISIITFLIFALFFIIIFNDETIGRWFFYAMENTISTNYCKILFIFVAIILVIIITIFTDLDTKKLKDTKYNVPEYNKNLIKNISHQINQSNNLYYIIVAITILSCMIMISSVDILSFILSLELQVFSSYILISQKYKNLIIQGKLKENHLLVNIVKYFSLNIAFSCIGIFGFAILYTITQEVEHFHIFNKLKYMIEHNIQENLLMFFISFILIISNIFLKLSIVPSHYIAMEVASSINKTSMIIFLTLQKIPGLIALFILINKVFPVYMIPEMQIFFFIISSITVIFGATLGVTQADIKKILFASSIMIFGILLYIISNFESIYLIINLFLSYIFGLIAIIFSMKIKNKYINSGLNNYIIQGSFLAKINHFTFIIGVFASMGAPPLFGFWGKYFAIFAIYEKKINKINNISGLNYLPFSEYLDFIYNFISLEKLSNYFAFIVILCFIISVVYYFKVIYAFNKNNFKSLNINNEKLVQLTNNQNQTLQDDANLVILNTNANNNTNNNANTNTDSLYYAEPNNNKNFSKITYIFILLICIILNLINIFGGFLFM